MKRSLFSALSAFALGAFLLAAPALAGPISLQSGPLDPSNQLANINTLVQAINVNIAPMGAGAITAGTFRPVGTVYTTTASVASAVGTSEQVLATYTLPASALDQVGRKLRIKSSFSAGATANNKTFKCYFGASVISSGVLTTNAKNGSCEVIVTKTGTNTQIVYGNMLVDTTNITGYVNLSGADTDTAAIVVKMTGTDGTSAAGDTVMNDFSVEYLN